MISAIVLVKNESEKLRRALDSLVWCDEIVVIDDDSEEDVAKIARSYHARYIKHKLEDFATQRNVGLRNAKNEWVLFIDSDEVVPSALRQEIEQTVRESSEFVGYKIKRKDVMWGRVLQHGEWGNQSFLRLAKKTAGTWTGLVHERWQVKGPTGQLLYPIVHYPHETVASFLSDINRYTTMRSNELFIQKKKTSAFHITFYPLVKFFQNYIFHLGILDGVPGLLLSVFMSLHSFLVRAKLFILWKKKD